VKSNRAYLTYLYFLFSILLIFLESQNVLRLIHVIPQATTIPIRGWLYQIRLNSLSPLGSLTTINEEIKQLRELQIKNASLQAEIASFQSLKEENTQMRRLLDTGMPATWKFSPARVVAVYEDSAYLVGETNTTVGMPVIISTDTQGKKYGVLVGKVKGLVGNQTKVDLITNSASKTPVVVRDVQTLDRRASGILQGRGDKAIIEQVLATEDLKEGDLVVTSGDGGLPPDLLIGSVGRVLTGSNATLKQAEVRLAVQPEGLQYVFFVTKY
jgi:rod shape-determining protein MreC